MCAEIHEFQEKSSRGPLLYLLTNNQSEVHRMSPTKRIEFQNKITASQNKKQD